MPHTTTLHHIMIRGKPYSEITALIALKLEQDNNGGYFSIRDFGGVDPVDWRRVMNKLRAVGYIKRVKKSNENGDKVTIYRDCGLREAFRRWSEKHDWMEYLY